MIYAEIETNKRKKLGKNPANNLEAFDLDENNLCFRMLFNRQVDYSNACRCALIFPKANM